MAAIYEARLTTVPKAIQILPVELNQEVASYLDSDKDVASFRASCRAARDAIDDEDSFWFRRFHQKYDPTHLDKSRPDFKVKLKELYQTRRKLLCNHPPHFKIGVSLREEKALKTIVGIVNDSFHGPSWPHRKFKSGQLDLTCRNVEVLKEVLRRTDIIDNIFRPRPPKKRRSSQGEEQEPEYSQLLAAVQLMFTSCILKHPGNIYGFDLSQKNAYATGRNAPIFVGFNKTEINMEYILHIMNFFKYHIGNNRESTLHDPFKKLSKSEKPLFWQSPIHNGPQNLGAHWHGTYAYLDREEMRIIRSPNSQNHILVDRNVDHGDGAIQTMNLAFPKSPPFSWPETFERCLRSLPKPGPARTRAQHRYGEPVSNPVNLRFQASGYDDEDFHAAGWLNQLPDQQGIHGWKRMTMMKYFEDGSGGWDHNALWAYEGVVLPGGQIILGRWWSPEPDIHGRESYTGPFIFWNTDASCDRVECDLHSNSNP